MAARELTLIVKTILPGMTMKLKRDSNDWTRQQMCYVNLGVTRRTDEVKETEREVLKHNGYSLTELDNKILACKPMDIKKDGNRV